MNKQQIPLRILQIEDDNWDSQQAATALQEVAAELDIAIDISYQIDGSEAIKYLRTCDPVPHVILLDLSLWGADGHAVARAIRADSRLSSIFVCVLSGSEAEVDISQALSPPQGCNLYAPKPLNPESLKDIARTLFAATDGLFRIAGRTQ